MELVAAKLRVSLREGSGDYFFWDGPVDGRRVILAVPTTYMNESGVAAVQLTEEFDLMPSDLLVVYDDFQLPLGTLRIRSEGSDGGHNGMASVIEHLLSEKIPRLRVGIAGASCPTEERKELMATYVLSPFEGPEKSAAETMIGHASDAVMSVLRDGMQGAMNKFNRSFLDTGSPEDGKTQ